MRFASSMLVSLFNEHSDMGDTVVGAGLMAGASFAKDVRKVQGIEAFAESGYWHGLALHLLDSGKLAEFRDGIEDQASNAGAIRLLLARLACPRGHTCLWRHISYF
jgi:hypothetical protein